MVKKALKLLTPLLVCIAAVFTVSARKPAPYTDYSSSTKPWNNAYATLTTYAEVCDGYYAIYNGGYWTKNCPILYSASTGSISHVKISGGIQCTSTVQFSFSGSTSPLYSVYTYHYY